MTLQPKTDFLTVEEYITGELESETRHEYINGFLHAMVGVSADHNLISLNVATALRTAARPTPCQVFMTDLKVYLNIGGEDIFYYPDILVSCDPDDRETYYRSHPCLLVEVLSPTTERIDRREKYLAYTSLKSLKEYILVSQDQQKVTVFRRKNNWQPEIFGPGDSFSLECLDCTLSMDQIYEDIDL